MNPVHIQIHRPAPAGTPLRPAVFLDRDGVIVEETGYLHRVADIRFIQGAIAAIAKLNRRAIPVVVVTNQSGIGRGYYGWPEYEKVQAFIAAELARENAFLDAVIACAAQPEEGHPFRKPEPGMIDEAAATLALDPSHSWLIGDKLDDMKAAHRAHLNGAIHVLTGYGQSARSSVREWAAAAPFYVRYAQTLAGAVDSLPR